MPYEHMTSYAYLPVRMFIAYCCSYRFVLHILNSLKSPYNHLTDLLSILQLQCHIFMYGCPYHQFPPAGKHPCDAGIRLCRERKGSECLQRGCERTLPLLFLWRCNAHHIKETDWLRNPERSHGIKAFGGCRHFCFRRKNARLG